MRYTFVDSNGIRSAVAAQTMKDLLAEQGKRNGAIRHAGIDLVMTPSQAREAYARALNNTEPTAMSQGWNSDFLGRIHRLDEMREDVEGADLVFAMGPGIAQKIRDKTSYRKPIIELDVQDICTDPQDQRFGYALREKLTPHV